MHVLVAFILGVTLISGFHPVWERPEDHSYVVVDADQHLRLSTYMTTADELMEKNVVMQEFDYSCGSAALATLLNYHLGEDLTEMQVIQGLMSYGNIERIRERRAFSLLDMRRFVDALGYDGQGFHAKMENLKKLDVPVILAIELFGYQHFVVFKGVYNDRVFLADPWLGNTTYSISAFEDMWYTDIILMVDPRERETLSMLSVAEEDLRYVEADLVRWTLFPPEAPGREFAPRREYKLIDPGVHYYKR